jgi:hypothetical protein
MPYHLEKVGRKYRVITTETGVAHSKKPISKKNAEAQLRILNAHMGVIERMGGFFNAEGNLVGPQTSDEKIGWELISAAAPFGTLELAPIVGNPVGALASVGAVEYSTQEETQAAAQKQSNDINKLYTALGVQSPRDLIASQQAALDAKRAAQFQAYLNQPAIQEAQAKAAWARQASEKASSDAQARRRQRSGVDKVFTDQEINDALQTQSQNAVNQESARVLYELGRKSLEQKLTAERIAKQTQASLLQSQQHLSGLNQKSLAMQAQVTNAKDALAKARILQRQRLQDQQLFLTKAADIKRKDFFDQERVAGEARQAMIAAEQRRQAIRAAAQAVNQPNPGPTNPVPMVPTLGRRLPPSVLWHG